jgi:hypothetical protein
MADSLTVPGDEGTSKWVFCVKEERKRVEEGLSQQIVHPTAAAIDNQN